MLKKNRPMNLADPFIISRVRQYLEENVHQTYVDVAVMARTLQERYAEYGRRKSVPFRTMVEQAYKTVLHSYGLDSNPSSEGNDASDLELMDTTSLNSNHMNNMLTNLYSKQFNKNKQRVAVNENESIDILSSDESCDEKEITITTVGSNNNNNNNNNNKSGTMKLQTQAAQQLASLRSVTVKVKGKSSDTADTGEKRNVVASFGPVNEGVAKKRRTNNQTDQQQQTQQLEQQQKNSVPNKSNNNEQGNNGMSTATLLRPKRFKKEITIQYPQYTFRDFGGNNKILKELCELLFHIKHPEIYHTIGISPPRGILLHGPPGCGKTLLANAVAGQLKIGLIEVPATELIAGVSGESEERIREIFEQALMVAPCVLFIDDIDAISSNRLNAQKDMERRIVSQLISSLDSLSKHENGGEQVMVIGATTRPECLDPALRRVGRFDHEVGLGVPDRKEREEILMIICDFLSLKLPFDYAKIAELTPGYVGADLVALATRAASIAVKRKYLNKMQCNIPVIDLINESVVDSTKDNESEEQNISTNEAVSDSTNNAVDKKDGTEKIQNKTNEQNTENIEHNLEEKNAEITQKNEVTVQDNKETNDKMEVDSSEDQTTSENKISDENVNSTTSNILENTSKIDNETIDVDELPDVVLHESTIKLSKAEASEITLDKQRSRINPSLSEMTRLLNSNVLQLEDHELEDICITMDDFEEALKVVQPSAKREGFITVPDVTWNDIGSLRDTREELQLAILAPVKYPERMEALGLNAPSGVLLCGPPGCGKTLLAKAIANEAGINFISVKGPELMNMYVGESERAVRTCFQRARNSAPCVIFFDEFDSLCPKRSDSVEGGSGTRVVNQLLTEMDGIEDRKGVFLMAATNRPDIIDPAILRPGRLDKILYVGLPEESDRVEILNALTKNRTQPVLDNDVDLSNIAKVTDGFTGADLAGLVRQASLLALKESLLNPDYKIEDLKVNNKHLNDAVKLCKPSVSTEDKKLYDKLKLKYTATKENVKSPEIL